MTQAQMDLGADGSLLPHVVSEVKMIQTAAPMTYCKITDKNNQFVKLIWSLGSHFFVVVVVFQCEVSLLTL